MRVTCCWQTKKAGGQAGGLKRKLKELKAATAKKATTARKGKHAKKGPAAKAAEPVAEPEEQIPPLTGFWTHPDGQTYTAVTTVPDGADLALPDKDDRLVYYLSKPKKDAGFYLVNVQKAMKDGNHWIKFYSDGCRGKVDDITVESHMKRWAYVKVAEESQLDDSNTPAETALSPTQASQRSASPVPSPSPDPEK